MLLHTDIKLLSLVLGEAIWGVVGITDDQLDGASTPAIILKVENGTRHLNLDTLGRRCKEWCNRDDDFYLLSGIGFCRVTDGGGAVEFTDFKGESTEPEAIIKATEWVAKEKGLL